MEYLIMMRLSGNVGNLTYSVEAAQANDLFESFGAGQEVFLDPTNHVCGICGCDNISFETRQVGEKNHTVYELACQGYDKDGRCWSKKTFGVKDDGKGTLFPHRKWGKGHSKEGEYIPNNGWKTWDKDAGEEVSVKKDN